jgi:tape measure domain-containing protein
MTESVSFALRLKDLASNPLSRLGQLGRTALRGIDKAAEEVNAELAKTGKEADKAKNRLGSLGSELQQMAGIYLGWQTVKDVLSLTAVAEDNRIALETMVGDAKTADALIKELSNKKSPLGFLELQDTTKRLLAFGFGLKEVMPTLDMFGDFAAVVGKDKLPQLMLALGQVRNAGRLQGDELNQLQESAVPVTEALAKSLGKSTGEIRKMAHNGEISFDQLYAALQGLREEGGRFYKAGEKYTEGISYKWTFAMSKLQQQTIRLTNTFAPAIKMGLDFAGMVLQNEFAVNLMASSLTVGAGAWLAYRLGATASAAATWTAIRGFKLGSLSAFSFSLSLRGIGKAMLSIPIIGWIGLAVEGFILLWQHSEKFRGVLYGIWEVVKELTTGLAPFAKLMFFAYTGQWHKVGGAFDEFKAAAQKGGGLGKAWERGMAKGKDQAPGEGQTWEQRVAGMNLAGGANDTSTSAGGDKGSGGVSISGSKPRTVIVNLNGALVDKLVLQAQNVTEGAGQIRDMIQRELVNAIRDFELSYE